MDLFISYRKEDTGNDVHTITKSIADFFEGMDPPVKTNIFLDDYSIPSSNKWIEEIEKNIRSSQILIVLIGTKWLTLKDSKGSRRIDDTKDILRREILFAIKLNKKVFPVLLNGATMPKKNQLPAPLRELVDYQAYALPDLQPRSMVFFNAQIVSVLGERQKEIKKQRQERDARDEKVLEKIERGEINSKSEFDWSIDPADVNDAFKDLPLFGKWRIDVSAPHSGNPAGLTRPHIFKVELLKDYTFTGKLMIKKAGITIFSKYQTLRFEGSWSVQPGENFTLFLNLKGILDRRKEFNFPLPVNNKRGNGYSGTDEFDRLFFYTSLGGKTMSEINKTKF